MKRSLILDFSKAFPPWRARVSIIEITIIIIYIIVNRILVWFFSFTWLEFALIWKKLLTEEKIIFMLSLFCNLSYICLGGNCFCNNWNLFFYCKGFWLLVPWQILTYVPFFLYLHVLVGILLFVCSVWFLLFIYSFESFIVTIWKQTCG